MQRRIEEGRTERLPLATLVRKHPRELILALTSPIGSFTAYYVILLFAIPYVVSINAGSAAYLYAVSTVALVVYLVGKVLAGEDRGEDEGCEHDDDQGGQQPPRAPQPEAAQVDPVSCLPLDEQQRGDEVAAEDEEEVDAEEAARQPVDPRVVEEDCPHRERAQAVQSRAVGDVRRVGDWLRHLPAAAA